MPDTREFFERGFEQISQNAAKLYKIGRLSAEHGEHAIGISLMILSCEESIKAVLCSMKFNDPEFPLEDWEEMFKFHKKKHDKIVGSIGVGIVAEQMYAETDKQFYDKIELLASQLGENGEGFSRACHEFFKKTKDELRLFHNLPDIDYKAMKKWWEHANALKQEGLYVGKNGSSWLVPSSLSISKYAESEQYADFFLKYGQRVMNTYRQTYISPYGPSGADKSESLEID